MEDKPLAYWRMSSTTGITVDDHTGHGHTMILTGNGVLVDAGAATNDVDDRAVSFDGKTSYAYVPDSGAFDFSGLSAFSIECWVKPSPLPVKADASAPAFHHIFTRAITGGGLRRGYFAYMPEAEEKVLGVRSTGLPTANQSYAGGTLGVDGKFHHLVAVMKPGSKWSLYIDDQEQKTDDKVLAAEPIEADFALAIDLPDKKNFFAGVIDEVAIYDHALDDVRIALHYSKGRR